MAKGGDVRYEFPLYHRLSNLEISFGWSYDRKRQFMWNAFSECMKNISGFNK